MSLQLPEGFIEYAKDWEAKINAFIELDLDGGNSIIEQNPAISKETAAVSLETASLVANLPFAVKDNIAVKGFLLTCGSKLLANFRSPYDATVVQKLTAAAGVVIGKTNLDEFGMGSSTDNSALKKTNNPWDITRVAGGSSGGSAAAVAAGIVPYALGTDTGGSVRQPAALCGVVGLKPTYGAASRFGLVAYSSSLECPGILADTIARCRAVFALIRGKDPMDQTTVNAPDSAPPLYSTPQGSQTKKIGVLSAGAVAADAQVPMLENEVRRAFDTAQERLATLGHTLVDVAIPALKYAVPAYYTIATAEASANLARFDSIRYGQRPDWAETHDELIDKAREMGFGPEVKLRILLGTFVLRSGFQDRYYLRAQRIRDGIRGSFEALLGDSEYKEQAQLDALLMPVFSTRAFGRGAAGCEAADCEAVTLSAFAQKAADLYTCCANLAGLPALSFPAGVEGGLPVGVQLVGRSFAEGTLLDIAEGYERQFPFPHPAGFRAFWSR